MGAITSSSEVVKHSTEDKVYTFDFTPLLESETITGSPTVTSATAGLTIGTPAANGSQVTVDDVTIATGAAVQVRVSGGTDSADYVLTCTAQTTQSNTHVFKGVLKVRDN